MSIVNIIYYLFLVIMILQGLVMIYLNSYIWLDEERLEKVKSPKVFLAQTHTFTILLPAYHEEQVLGETIARVAKMNYPTDKFEMLIILQPSDQGTIEVANKSIKDNVIPNARVLVVDPDHVPLNKPYQMNFALAQAKYEKIVIFDSEDEVHPDILNVANTLYKQNKVDIIQAGVQLVNYYDRWFCPHNVLEYFFWFKSRMHAHIRIGAVPLGGNTVFFKTDQLRDIGGWNEACLTEDAEIGLRLCGKGAKMFATYDAEHVTKEETPLTIEQFVKQRTRWVQGFLQIMQAKTWKQLHTRKQRAMAVYLIGFPVVQAVLFALSPVAMMIGILGKLPFIVSLLSFLPMIMIAALIGVQVVGLYELIKEQHLKFKIRGFFWLIVMFFPYQVLLSAGALRATWRHFKKRSNWEKTTHVGAHRIATSPSGVKS